MATIDPHDTTARDWLETEKLRQEIRTEMARRNHWRAQAWLMAIGASVGTLGLGVSVVTLVLRLVGVIGPTP